MSSLKKRLNKTAFNAEDAYKSIEQISKDTTTVYDGLENIERLLERNVDVKEALSTNGINADEFYAKISELSSYFDNLSRDLKDVLDKIDF